MGSKKAKAIQRQNNYKRMMPNEWGKLAYNVGDYRQVTRIQMYEQLIETLALSRFQWTGLPQEIDARFMELSLFEQGFVLFFYDEDNTRFMTTYANYSGRINMYFNPTEYYPFGNGYHYRMLSSKECVPIWDNQLRAPLLTMMHVYAERLANLDRAFDVNLDNISVPLIVSCDEKQKQTLQNLIKQRDSGLPVIYAYDSLDLNHALQTFPNTTPNLTDKILEVKAQVWNECVKFMGIENSNSEKKERLISDEVQAGAESTNVFRLSFLKARQQACDQINTKFPALTVGINWANDSTGGMVDVSNTNE